MKNIRCHIRDEGDPSVGIFPVVWEMECPFTKSDMDDEQLEWFREKVAELYGEFAEGHLIVQFDFEMIYDTD